MGLLKYCLVAALLGCLPTPGLASTDNWVLDHAAVTYTVHHPLKTASGTSRGSRGNGQCDNGKCKFLLAAPVKSFESGDSNLDLHMIQVTRGGTYPMVVVRSTVDESDLEKGPVPLTLNIEFAGKKATYRNVPFETVSRGEDAAHLKGTFVIKLSDFAITPPSLLTMPIKNDVSIDVDAYWRKTRR